MPLPFTISFLRTHAGFSHNLSVPTLSGSSDRPAEEPAQRRLPTSAHARAMLPGSSESWAPEPVRHKASSQNESDLPVAQILGEVCQHDTLWTNPNCALQTLEPAEAVTGTVVRHNGACSPLLSHQHCPHLSRVIPFFNTFANRIEEMLIALQAQCCCFFGSEHALLTEHYVCRGFSPRHWYNLFFMFMANFCLSKPVTSDNSFTVTNHK